MQGHLAVSAGECWLALKRVGITGAVWRGPDSSGSGVVEIKRKSLFLREGLLSFLPSGFKRAASMTCSGRNLLHILREDFDLLLLYVWTSWQRSWFLEDGWGDPDWP
jgi:hypothetical protein